MNAEEGALLGVEWRVTTRRRLLEPSLTAQDQLFAYDGLCQVTDRERGVLDTGNIGIVGTPAQAEDFGCDETGNWVRYQQNSAGVLDIDQTRENNVSNQITEIDSASAGISYDLNGNMLLVPTTESLEGPFRQLVWDAWNRLRIVKDDGDNVLKDFERGLPSFKPEDSSEVDGELAMDCWKENGNSEVSSTPRGDLSKLATEGSARRVGFGRLVQPPTGLPA